MSRHCEEFLLFEMTQAHRKCNGLFPLAPFYLYSICKQRAYDSSWINLMANLKCKLQQLLVFLEFDGVLSEDYEGISQPIRFLLDKPLIDIVFISYLALFFVIFYLH